MYKKIYVNTNGDLVSEGSDLLASLEDLNFAVSCGESPIKGIIEIANGEIYSWFDNLDDEESINDIGEVCEYIKVSSSEVVNPLYEYLMQEYNENIHTVISCNIEDNRVRALVKNKNKNWLYICSTFRDLDGLIQKTRTMVNKNIAINICEVDMAV